MIYELYPNPKKKKRKIVENGKEEGRKNGGKKGLHLGS